MKPDMRLRRRFRGWLSHVPKISFFIVALEVFRGRREGLERIFEPDYPHQNVRRKCLVEIEAWEGLGLDGNNNEYSRSNQNDTCREKRDSAGNSAF